MVEMDLMKPNLRTAENLINCFQGGKNPLIYFFPIAERWFLAKYFTQKNKKNPQKTEPTKPLY